MRSLAALSVYLKVFFTIAVLTSASASYGQSINAKWKQDLETTLEEFLKCKTTASDDNRCHQFIGESLNKVYKINDFYSQKSGKFMAVSEIAEFLKSNSKWELLGHSYDQKTLETAQEHANAKKAVVALYLTPEGTGHAVVITPGELKPSGSWGLLVPSAVSFFSTEPSKSFVDKGLSYAFAKNMLKDVQIYGRNY